MKIEVSTKHLKLRIILTIVFFLIAITAFTIGVLSIGRKSPGYQQIEAKTDSEALLYNNAVGFRYFFDGSSNEIKGNVNVLKDVYTPILSAAYKQLDHQNTYNGQVSIGTVNSNIGENVSVSPELYAILKDALRRTEAKEGFNMFAGALYAEWKSILILDEPGDFDPDFNEFEAQRLEAIAQEVSDLSNFSLEFLDDARCIVRLTVSDGYRAFCEDYEIDSPVLDLNVLHDAYMLRLIGDNLVSAGYSMGYLYTSEGLVLNMAPLGSLGYDMYTLESGRETVYASLQLDGAFSAANFTAFSMGSPYGYELDGKFRHLYFNAATGKFSDVIMASTVISPDEDIVEDVCRNIVLNNLDSESAVGKYVSELGDEGVIVSYVLQSSYVK